MFPSLPAPYAPAAPANPVSAASAITRSVGFGSDPAFIALTAKEAPPVKAAVVGIKTAGLSTPCPIVFPICLNTRSGLVLPAIRMINLYYFLYSIADKLLLIT